MKHVYIRHGETDYNAAKKRCSRGDARLTEIGHHQAVQAYEQIKNQISADDVIVLSPLYRTFQTATPTLKALYPTYFEKLESAYLMISQNFQTMFDEETIQDYVHDAQSQKMFQLIPELPVYVDFRLCELLLSVDQQ